MRPCNQTAGGAAGIAASGAFAAIATFALGGCMLEEIVAPVEATEVPPEIVEAADAEAPPPAVEAPAQPMIRGWPPGPVDLPLIMVDGIRTAAGRDEIAALAIESFEIVHRTDAVAQYGEAAKNGAILIFTKNPDDQRVQHSGDREFQ